MKVESLLPDGSCSVSCLQLTIFFSMLHCINVMMGIATAQSSQCSQLHQTLPPWPHPALTAPHPYPQEIIFLLDLDFLSKLTWILVKIWPPSSCLNCKVLPPPPHHHQNKK